MKKFTKLFCVTAISLSMLTAPFIPYSSFAEEEIYQASAATARYDSAEEVVYAKPVSVNGRSCIANWGARDEECSFLSKYATAFYSGNNTYEVFSQKSGNAQQSQAHTSALYSSLQTFMTSKHTYFTYYDGSKNVRDFYKYTDCVKNDTSKVALLYVGTMESSTWNQGNIWNQEHTWPQSKLSSKQAIGDIMQLRPEDPKENSRRGNDAYGNSSGYYNPDSCGQNVQGDCARSMLYMYVRYGEGNMWGKNGVMESRDVLLQWMENDPVDTWEMGRNDAVQSVTGTRNVFIDYPELAWLLFNQEIPTDMDTPSGIAKSLADNGSDDSSSDNTQDSSSDDSSSDDIQDSSSNDSSSDDIQDSSSNDSSSDDIQDNSSNDSSRDDTKDSSSNDSSSKDKEDSSIDDKDDNSSINSQSSGLADYPFNVDISSCGASISVSGVGSLLLAGAVILFCKKKRQ